MQVALASALLAEHEPPRHGSPFVLADYCPQVLAALALATCLSLPLAACGGGSPTPEAPLAGAQLGGDFTLVNQAGKTVHAADFAGKYTVFYFGYTYCPDVCPLDTANLMQGYHAFAKAHPDKAARLVPIFVSIDPARDTPQVLASSPAISARNWSA
jgi:protein SCO1/2